VAEAIRGAVAPELLRRGSEEAPPAPQPIPFRGKWVGTVTNYAGTQPLSLTFQDDGDVAAQLADQESAKLVRPAFADGAFTGQFSATSNIPEAARRPHQLQLKVVSVDGELVGQLVASALNKDVALLLPSFVRLRSASEAR
jgi:hypothetical protein